MRVGRDPVAEEKIDRREVGSRDFFVRDAAGEHVACRVAVVGVDSRQSRVVEHDHRLDEVDGDAEVAKLLNLDFARIAVGHNGTGHGQVAKNLHVARCRIASIAALLLPAADVL